MYKIVHIGRLLIFFSLLLFLADTAAGQITGIKIVGDTCNSLTLNLQALGTSSSPYFFWNFGDPASGTNDTITITGASASPYPTHTFSGPGVYTVCVSLQEPGSPVTTVCRTISIGLCCNGYIRPGDSCLNSATFFTVETAASVTSIAWNFGDPASGAANTSTLTVPSHIFSAAGTYTVTAFVTALCDTFTVSYTITIVNCGAACTGIIQMNDSCFQSGSDFIVTSSSPITAYSWNFGDPSTGGANTSTSGTPTHAFSAPGTYAITVTASASCGVFTAAYTANIINCPPLCLANILFSDSCAGGNSIFNINTNSTINSVNWSFGDPSSGTLNTSNLISADHTFSAPGNYTVTATTALACGALTVTRNISIVDCARELEGCKAVLPTGFTPNGDGQNDILFVRSEDLASIKTFRVYNRWGQLLFEKIGGAPNDESAGWDGKYKGEICAPDIYMYYLEGKCTSGKNILEKGDVMIIR